MANKQKSKTPEQLANEMQRAVLPAAQFQKAAFVLVDVQNYTDADQRVMVRSKQTKTIRRLTRLEKLAKRKVLTEMEARACEWYAAAHAARYDTTGTTANYGESSGACNANFDHLPKTQIQWEAMVHYDMARGCIPPMIRPMFERIVLDGKPIGKLRFTFCYAVRSLLKGIEGKVAL